MTVAVRAAGSRDAATVAALVRGLNESEGYDPARGPGPDAVRAAFLGPDAAGGCLVAEEEGGVIGYVTFHVTYETTHASRGAYVGDLFVRAEARRRGIGRSLLAAAARAVREAGGEHLWWTSLPANAAGRAFYEGIGAEAEPVTAHALTNGAFARLADRAA